MIQYVYVYINIAKNRWNKPITTEINLKHKNILFDDVFQKKIKPSDIIDSLKEDIAAGLDKDI